MVLSSTVIIVVSLSTDAPADEVVSRYVWSPKVYTSESQELSNKPYYLNYRVLSVLLLVATGIFFIIWR